MTLKEYLMDYATPRIFEMGNALIENEIGVVPNPKVRALVTRKLAEIEQGARDFRI
jgi:2-iminoacetate synthase